MRDICHIKCDFHFALSSNNDIPATEIWSDLHMKLIPDSKTLDDPVFEVNLSKNSHVD